MKRRHPCCRWFTLTAALAGLFLADIALFAFLPLSVLYPDIPAHDRQPVAVAAILFNGFSPSRTGINDETRRRLHHGLELLRHSQARLLLVAGGNRPGQAANGARLMATYLRDRGVAAEQIIIEDQSRDSRSNLARIRTRLRELGLASAGLVSSPHHLLRIRSLPGQAATGFTFLPYNATVCDPPLTRWESWRSAHSNLAAWLTAVLLSEGVYSRIVGWVRTNTTL